MPFSYWEDEIHFKIFSCSDFIFYIFDFLVKFYLVLLSITYVPPLLLREDLKILYNLIFTYNIK